MFLGKYQNKSKIFSFQLTNIMWWLMDSFFLFILYILYRCKVLYKPSQFLPPLYVLTKVYMAVSTRY